MADLVKIKNRIINFDKVREVTFLDERIVLEHDDKAAEEWVVVPDNKMGGGHKITAREYSIIVQGLQNISRVII